MKGLRQPDIDPEAVLRNEKRRGLPRTMVKRSAHTKATPAKRQIGHPTSGDVVGREGLLAATEKLLRVLPPARVTFGRIAAEANVNPSLIRYHFASRTALFLAVIDRVTSHATRFTETIDEPDAALADHISKTVRFVRSAPFMHRLMIDEMVNAGTDEARTRVVDLNRDLVSLYKRILQANGGNRFTNIDPLLVHLLVLGASDFFASAEPIIVELMPAGKDLETLSRDFEAFLTEVLMKGLEANDQPCTLQPYPGGPADVPAG